MSEHDWCVRDGKFDCDADEDVSGFVAVGGSGEGHVEAPCGWFDGVTLHLSLGNEQRLAEHYGTRWLIAREDSSGFFRVETFATERSRDERLEELVVAWVEWTGGML